MGYRRSYYRFKSLYERKGQEALYEIVARSHMLSNSVDPSIEKAVIDRTAYLAYGQLNVSNELKQQGILVSHKSLFTTNQWVL